MTFRLVYLGNISIGFGKGHFRSHFSCVWNKLF